MSFIKTWGSLSDEDSKWYFTKTFFFPKDLGFQDVIKKFAFFVKTISSIFGMYLGKKLNNLTKSNKWRVIFSFIKNFYHKSLQ